MDITRNLELLSNIRGVAMIGAQDVSEIAAEALAEIERLRAHERASEKWLAELVPHPTFVMPALRPPTDDSKPEPWGSPFAMNTENWK